MATTTNSHPLFSTFSSVIIFLILLHLGCFTFFSSPKKRKLISPKPTTWSFLKRLFKSKPDPLLTASNPTHQHNPSIQSPCSSTRSLHKPIVIPFVSPDDLIPPRTESESDPLFFPLRNDIYPCPLCGEVFNNPNNLEQHKSIKHAVSDLVDGDSGNNIVRIIFKTGWPEKTTKKNPIIHRILKVHNSPKILTRFEEYREYVKSKAARNDVVVRKRDERCVADGNELLRFHCATFMCELGQNGNSSLCSQQYCSLCGIIKSGFSSKMDGIATQSSSWRGHVAIPEEIEEEFGFMNVKRAMLVCRVIAGRIGCDPDLADKEDPGFDSLVSRENGVHMRFDEDDELLVFNPRAVLPCFVIVYTV